MLIGLRRIGVALTGWFGARFCVPYCSLQGDNYVFQAQWLVYLPPGLTFYPLRVFVRLV